MRVGFGAQQIGREVGPEDRRELLEQIWASLISTLRMSRSTSRPSASSPIV